MTQDERSQLQRRMAEAVAAEDFETAALLRDRLKAVDQPASNPFTRQVPGHMGLGTSDQALRPAKGWIPPAKPDPMTANHRPRKGRPAGEGGAGR